MNSRNRNPQNAWTTEYISSDTIPVYRPEQSNHQTSAYYLPQGIYDPDACSDITTSFDNFPSDFSGDYDLEPEVPPFMPRMPSGVHGAYTAQKTIRSSVPLDVQAEYEECCMGSCMSVAILNMGLITRWYGVHTPYAPAPHSYAWAANKQPSFFNSYNAKFDIFVRRQGNRAYLTFCYEIIPVKVERDIGCLEYYAREWQISVQNFASDSWADISYMPQQH